MSEDQLTSEERIVLLALARQALESGVRGNPLPPLGFEELPARLQEIGATFVTLTIQSQLRGCIGILEPYRSLADDVREHAIAAALNDYRFPRVQPEELPQIAIEISRLTVPRPLDYDGPEDLLAKIRPGIDGLVLRDGARRATFLPQVWEKLPDPADFLDQLCRKMGTPADLWRHKQLAVETYQVEEFHE
ncbi:MAG: AmmeMemoRadiSam system protein A [Chloroflexi bacterium]|nr:AmmeMemoRadiSam system protein A [Chloroflexota bacterium]